MRLAQFKGSPSGIHSNSRCFVYSTDRIVYINLSAIVHKLSLLVGDWLPRRVPLTPSLIYCHPLLYYTHRLDVGWMMETSSCVPWYDQMGFIVILRCEIGPIWGFTVWNTLQFQMFRLFHRQNCLHKTVSPLSINFYLWWGTGWLVFTKILSWIRFSVQDLIDSNS